MNIFKALSEGNGRISETNLTSFLSFLLNNNKLFGSSFFLLFIDGLSKILENNHDVLQLIGNSFRERSADFERKYIHLAIPEFPVKYRDKKQIIEFI